MAVVVPKGGEVYYAEDGTASIVLEDTWDASYEPTDAEKEEYAKCIGIDPEKEKDLMWIAREGLKAPLPKEWKPCKTDTGEVYYFNFKSGDSVWEHPMDDHYREVATQERAKIAKGGKSSAPSSLSTSGATKSARKGAAGADDDHHAKRGAQAAAATAASVALPEALPKKGRLGALGSGAVTAARPDISDLVPPKNQTGAGGAGGPFGNLAGLGPGAAALAGRKEPLRNPSLEEERRFREKYGAELNAARATLKQKHDKQLEEALEELKSTQRHRERQGNDELQSEIERGKRAVDSRIKRELQLFEDSIDKQKADLRRTLADLQQQVDAERSAAGRRVDSEAFDRRAETDRRVQREAAQRAKELEEAWAKEKTEAEASTNAKIRDLQATVAMAKENALRKERITAQLRLSQVDEEISKDAAQIRSSVASQRAAHTAAVAQQQSQQGSSTQPNSAEYDAAEAAYKAAIAEARTAAERVVAAAKSDTEAERQRLLQEHAAAKLAAVADAKAVASSGAALSADSFKASQAQQLDALRARLAGTIAAEADAYAAETAALVSGINAKAAKALEGAGANQAEMAAARAASELDFAARRRALEVAHEAAMASVASSDPAVPSSPAAPPTAPSPAAAAELTTKAQADFQARCAAWVKEHPAAPPPRHHPAQQQMDHQPAPTPASRKQTTFSVAAVESAVAADRDRLAASHGAALAALRQALEAEQQAQVARQRRELMAQMAVRLEDYRHQAPTRSSSSMGGPVLAAVASPAGHSDGVGRKERQAAFQARLGEETQRRTVALKELEASLLQQLAFARQTAVAVPPLGPIVAAGNSAAGATAATPSPSALDAANGATLRSASSLSGFIPVGSVMTADGVWMPPPPYLTRSATPLGMMMTMSHTNSSRPNSRPTTRTSDYNNVAAGAFDGLPPQRAGVPPLSPERARCAPARQSPSADQRTPPQRHQQPERADHAHHRKDNSDKKKKRGGEPSKRASGDKEEGSATKKAPPPPPAIDAKNAEERLARAAALLAEKKAKVRERQLRIEAAREEWRRDMAKAKEGGDTEKQRTLHTIKKALESEARLLNDEALQVRESAQWLKRKETEIRSAVQQQQQQHGDHRHDGDQPAMAAMRRRVDPHADVDSRNPPPQQEQPTTTSTAGVAPTGDVAGLLQFLVNRVAAMEGAFQKMQRGDDATRPVVVGHAATKGLLEDERQQQQRDGGGGGRGRTDLPPQPQSTDSAAAATALREKWSVWLPEEESGVPPPPAGRLLLDGRAPATASHQQQPLQTIPSPKEKDVQRWLEEMMPAAQSK